MALGEELVNQVKSKLSAVIAFNRREELRKWLALRILLVLLVLFVVVEVQEIVRPKIVFIDNSEASTLNQTLMQVGEEKPSQEVAKAISVTSPEEVIGSNDKKLLPTVGIEEKVCRKWKDDCKLAIAVMKAESQGDPTRIGDKHLTFIKDGREYGASYGLFQLRDLPGRFENPKEMLNEDKNIEYAYKMWEKQGFSPWSAYSNKTYLKYL